LYGDVGDVFSRKDGDVAAKVVRGDVEFAGFDFGAHDGFYGLGDAGASAKKGADDCALFKCIEI
jgi:hypothetical protein